MLGLVTLGLVRGGLVRGWAQCLSTLNSSGRYLSSFKSTGYSFPNYAMSQEQARKYRTKLEQHEQEHGLAGNSRFKLHVVLPWAAELVRNQNILDKVESEIGPDFLIWSSDVNIKEPGSSGFFSWHQDSTYAGLLPNEDGTLDAVTVWVALTDVAASSGGLRFLPGTHVSQLPHHEMKGSDNMLSLGQTIPDAELDLDTAVSVLLKPGQFSMHNFRLVHASGPNRGTDRRIGFAIRYVATHVAKAGAVRELATLARGEDKFGHFDHEPAPSAAMAEEAEEVHKDAMQREETNYFAGKGKEGF